MLDLLSPGLLAELDCSSPHLNSGCGFPAPTTKIFVFDPIWHFTVLGVDFNFGKPMIMAVMFSILIVVFFVMAFGRAKVVPSKFQSVGELGYLFVRDQISRETIGKNGDKFVPFLFSLFFFIFVLNFLEILPGAQMPVTSIYAFPVALALMVWVVYMYLGVRHQGPWGFFRNMMFPPGVPVPIYFILSPIELISNVLVRPFTLSIRLFANMFAGHILLTVFTVATLYLMNVSLMGILGTTTSFLMTVIMTAFELLIEFLQAYIFTLLTASYIAGSLHAEH